MQPGPSEISPQLRIKNLKAAERRIVGRLLVEFFEVERDLNQILNAWIFNPANTDVLDTILINTPLRYKIKAANEFSVLSDKEAKIFQGLCDQRNRLAHGPMKMKSIADMFPGDVQRQFVKQCRFLRKAMDREMDEIIEHM